MEEILLFVGQVLGVLSIGLLGTAIIAGLIFGALYDYKLNISNIAVFNRWTAGLVFMLFIFIYRLVVALSIGSTVPMVFGWFGVAIIWSIFCGTTVFGRKGIKYIVKKLI